MLGAPVTAALLAALSQEVRPFFRRVQARRLAGVEWPVWEFSGKRGKGVAVVAGMGEAAAGRAAGWILEQYKPRVLISLGFGGAVTPELPAGAVVLGGSYWRYEPVAGVLREVEAPPAPVPLQDMAAKLRGLGLPAFLGTLVTTSGIIHKDTQRGPLVDLAHPVLDLETSAAAAAALALNLPFMAVRAVTDTASEEIPDFIRQAAREGRLPGAGTALAWLAGDPRRLAALVHLWRRSRLAGRNLALALEVALEMV
jgi:adenosylhomocysteine nucleosidase